MRAIIAYDYEQNTRSKLIESAKPYGVAKTGFHFTLKLLKDLELIKERSSHRKEKKVILTSLTDKGLEVVKKMIDINKIFESKEES